MSKKKKQNVKINESNTTTEGWDFIINNIVVQIAETEAQTARLRVSLEYFEKRRASGERFCGEKKLRSIGLI